MKKFYIMLFIFLLSVNSSFADFAEHYNLGQTYLSQYQYSSAIMEFKRALRINYMDNSARIGLINAFLARGTFSANKESNYANAAADYRSALFYLKYYATSQQINNSQAAIVTTTENLNKCLKQIKFDTTSQNRYETGMKFRQEGQFAAAGYEFAQSALNSTYKKRSLVQLGDIMKLLGNNPMACEYYKQAVNYDGNDARVRLKYARILDNLDRTADATNQYNIALAKCENDTEILIALERIYLNKTQENPNDAEAFANLGAVYQKEGHFDDALKMYSKAEYINPTNVTTRMNVGTLYQAQGNYENALLAYQSILSAYPDNKEAMYLQAQCLAKLDRKVEALEAYKKVVAVDSNNTYAKTEMFAILKDTMSPQEMLEYLSQNVGVDAKSLDTMYDYAVDLHNQGKYDEAIEYYKAVLKKKSFPDLYINLASAMGQKEDYANAQQVLNSAKKMYPEDSRIVQTMNSLEHDRTAIKYDEATKLFNKAEYDNAIKLYNEIQPATAESLSAIAACYQKLNNSDLALQYYQKSFVLNPQAQDIAYYIGSIYAEKEDWGNAKKYLKQVKNYPEAKELLQSVIEQNNVNVLNTAIDLFEKGDYTSSLKYLSQILSEDSKNGYAYYYRGMIYDAQKKYPQAIEQYQKAVTYATDLPTAYYMMAIDYDSLAQYKNALTYYKKFVEMNKNEDEYTAYSKGRIPQLKKYE